MIVGRGTKKRPKPPIVICYGGLAWRFVNDGETRPRCDIWLDVQRPDLLRSPRLTLALVRWARRVIRIAVQLGEPAVYCVRDDEPNSAKLLELVGLEKLAEAVIVFDGGAERTGDVWKWQRSPRSEASSPSDRPS